MADVEQAGAAAYGYAFFHAQDTERAVEGGGLYLNYGARQEGEAAALAVGHAIVATLAEHGFQTDWDGSIGRRIGVAISWRKRRSSVAALPLTIP